MPFPVWPMILLIAMQGFPLYLRKCTIRGEEKWKKSMPTLDSYKVYFYLIQSGTIRHREETQMNLHDQTSVSEMLIKSYFKFAYCAELVFIVAHVRKILFHRAKVLMITWACGFLGKPAWQSTSQKIWRGCRKKGKKKLGYSTSLSFWALGGLI